MAGHGAVETKTQDGAVLVSPTGDVDKSCSPKLRESLRAAQDSSPDRLIVDLSSVQYMDSSGLATLVEAMKNAKGAQTRLVLAGMNPKVKAIFEIARLHQYFLIVDSTADAMNA